MYAMTAMPIDLATVDWLYVAVLAVFVFVATLIADLLSFDHRVMGAVLSAVLFAAVFVFWTYYPHHLPLPTALTPPKAAVTRRPRRPLRPRRPGRAIRSPTSRRRPLRLLRRQPPCLQVRPLRARLASNRLIDVLSRLGRVTIVRESGGVA